MSVTETRTELTTEEMRKMNAYWRAANYLSIGQIYLLDNPLLQEPLKLEHVKPRLLGHWGTTPGLNFIYVHLNRLIKMHDLNVIYVAGPGHGGPGLVANTYLEGTYSEFYPNISQDEPGMKKLFKQFSFPGGIPSHVAPETPGSIHEGGELGYALVHAYGAVFDNPDLLAWWWCVWVITKGHLPGLRASGRPLRSSWRLCPRETEAPLIDNLWNESFGIWRFQNFFLDAVNIYHRYQALIFYRRFDAKWNFKRPNTRIRMPPFATRF